MAAGAFAALEILPSLFEVTPVSREMGICIAAVLPCMIVITLLLFFIRRKLEQSGPEALRRHMER